MQFLKMGLIGLVLLQGCTTAPKLVQQDKYDVQSRQHLYELKQWFFEGRMAITSEQDSWTANAEWKHEQTLDTITLSGPLGQGAVVIKLTDDHVSVDQGDGKIEASDDPDGFVMQKLGVFVPVSALTYWVMGLPDPDRQVTSAHQGFEQDGWKVSYKEWQSVGVQQMPHKVNVMNEKVKLKLVFDRWQLHHD